MAAELTVMPLLVGLVNVTVRVPPLPPSAVTGKLGLSGVAYACSVTGAVTSRTNGAEDVAWLRKTSLALSVVTPYTLSMVAVLAGCRHQRTHSCPCRQLW